MINIITLKLDEIKPYEKNPRNNEGAVEAVKNSIKEFGIKVPIVVDAENVIITGHTRYEACKQLGIKEIPCVKAEDLTEKQAKAFRLADNKVAEMASWDFNLLDEELELIETDMNMFGFNLGNEEIGMTQAINSEIDLDDFGDETFEYECPLCGFRFNE